MISGFLLDTDTVSYVLRAQGNAAARMFAEHPSAIFVSSITVAELDFGLARRPSAKLRSRIDAFLKFAQLRPLDLLSAQRFGKVAAHLEKIGKPIGPLDTLIASQALAHKMTLVSNNTKHFSCVPGLKLENWL